MATDDYQYQRVSVKIERDEDDMDTVVLPRQRREIEEEEMEPESAGVVTGIKREVEVNNEANNRATIWLDDIENEDGWDDYCWDSPEPKSKPKDHQIGEVSTSNLWGEGDSKVAQKSSKINGDESISTGCQATATGESSPESGNEKVETEAKQDCVWDCIQHARQNELLKAAVSELSNRNTILEDFIQVKFGGEFKEFLMTRERLLEIGFGDIGKQVDGKRSAKSGEFVELLTVIHEAKIRNETQSNPSTSGTFTQNSKPSPPPPVNKRKPSALKKSKPPSKSPPKKGKARPADSDSSSYEDDDVTGVNPDKLMDWKQAGKKRKLRICPICNVTVKLRNLRDHLMVVHSAIKINCPTCHLEFPTRMILMNHLMTHHKWTEGAYSAHMKGVEDPIFHWLNNYYFAAKKPAFSAPEADFKPLMEVKKGGRNNRRRQIPVAASRLSRPPYQAPMSWDSMDQYNQFDGQQMNPFSNFDNPFNQF